jgi:hypothetical protein
MAIELRTRTVVSINKNTMIEIVGCYLRQEKIFHSGDIQVKMFNEGIDGWRLDLFQPESDMLDEFQVREN